MASIKNLKKEINYVLGDLIDVVTIWEITSGNEASEKGKTIIDDIINTYDSYIERINNKQEIRKGSYFQSLKKDFEKDVTALVEKINALS